MPAGAGVSGVIASHSHLAAHRVQAVGVELVHDLCGHVTEVVPRCRECGEELRIGEMHSVLGPGAGGEPLPPHLRPLPRR